MLTNYVARDATISLALSLFYQYKRIAQDLHNKLVVFRIGKHIAGLFR